jgi:hypothetical protein
MGRARVNREFSCVKLQKNAVSDGKLRQWRVSLRGNLRSWDLQEVGNSLLKDRGQLSGGDQFCNAREILIHDAVFLHDGADRTDSGMGALQRL